MAITSKQVDVARSQLQQFQRQTPVLASRRPNRARGLVAARDAVSAYRRCGERPHGNGAQFEGVDTWIMAFIWLYAMIIGVPVDGAARELEEKQLEAMHDAKSMSIPAPIAIPAKQTLGARGATPMHYRAFSLLQPRLSGLAATAALAVFRERVKTIKLEDSEVIRNEALQLMDHFVQLVDRYVPLHDAEEGDRRAAIQAKLLAALTRLDEALSLILARNCTSSDGFDTAARFIELRYADAGADDFSLTSI